MNWKFVLVLLAAFIVTAQAQDTSSARQQKAALYTCSMHRDVRSANAGECPKCGMDLIAMADSASPQMKHGAMPMMQADSSAPKHKRDMKALMNKKFQLMKENKYRCCIDGACDECVEEGGCNCRGAVEHDKPVCDECYMGWMNGDGKVPGKDLKDIKHEKHHPGKTK